MSLTKKHKSDIKVNTNEKSPNGKIHHLQLCFTTSNGYMFACVLISPHCALLCSFCIYKAAAADMEISKVMMAECRISFTTQYRGKDIMEMPFSAATLCFS